MTFNNRAPGPKICVDVGDRVQVMFENKTELNHTIHRHGLRFSIVRKNRYRRSTTVTNRRAPCILCVLYFCQSGKCTTVNKQRRD
ncbi:MAG TPA: hypothetical protein ENH29_04055 [Bacteroidetes bacterium]|nr:hypothetical protein [Bacteroidota bacterium]